MVDILDPQLGEAMLDPACGTGGFLTCTIEHLKAQVKTAADAHHAARQHPRRREKPLPHMLAMTSLMLHGIDVPSNIRHDNTLSRPLKDYGPKDRWYIILTNPPFGGHGEDGIENNFPRKYQTRETADLFMALIMHLTPSTTLAAPPSCCRMASCLVKAPDHAQTRTARRVQPTHHRAPARVFAPTPASPPMCCSSKRARPIERCLVL